MIKEFDVANITIYLQKETMEAHEFTIKYVKIKN